MTGRTLRRPEPEVRPSGCIFCRWAGSKAATVAPGTLPDPGALIADFTARKTDLPVDYQHQSDAPLAEQSGPVPAAGWIKELRLATNALWGRVEWTERARALIEAKEYRYLSPVFWHDKAGRIGRLKGAGLVHTPNLHLKALAAEEAPMTDTPETPEPAKAPDPAAMLAKILGLLGLPPDADAQALMAALEKALADPDPKRLVPVAAVQEMLRDRNARLAPPSEAAAGSRSTMPCGAAASRRPCGIGRWRFAVRTPTALTASCPGRCPPSRT